MDVSLMIFIVVLTGNILALLLDLVLLIKKDKTITRRVRENPMLGLPLLLWQLIGIISLAVHFYL